jgi:hypothetical protein
MAPTYAAANGGNLTGNGSYTRTVSFGLAWCGTNVPGGLSSCNDPQIPAQDVAFLYHNVCQPSLPDVDFTSAHPEWVALIQNQALKTLKAAFAQYGIPVAAASKDKQTTWAACQTDPECLNTNVADQSHVVRVGGDLNPKGYGITAGGQLTPAVGMVVTKSNVYYYLIMTSSVDALATINSPSNAPLTWCPIYPPGPGTGDLQKFQNIMTTIGTTIGNAAAHELGHQLSKFPYMDCGPGYGNPPYGPCEKNNNFVYNFWNETPSPNDPNDPSDPANGGLFFYGLDVKPIEWEKTNRCYLRFWADHEVSSDAGFWGTLWNAIITPPNPCQQ